MAMQTTPDAKPQLPSDREPRELAIATASLVTGLRHHDAVTLPRDFLSQYLPQSPATQT